MSDVRFIFSQSNSFVDVQRERERKPQTLKFFFKMKNTIVFFPLPNSLRCLKIMFSCIQCSLKFYFICIKLIYSVGQSSAFKLINLRFCLEQYGVLIHALWVNTLRQKSAIVFVQTINVYVHNRSFFLLCICVHSPAFCLCLLKVELINLAVFVFRQRLTLGKRSSSQ